jgi:hypothetical protein
MKKDAYLMLINILLSLSVSTHILMFWKLRQIRIKLFYIQNILNEIKTNILLSCRNKWGMLSRHSTAILPFNEQFLFRVTISAAH